MALHRAIVQGRLKQVKYLLETCNYTNNDINAKDDDTKTPLILTCNIEHIKIATSIARLLLKSGAQVGIVDSDGRNALSHACIRKRHELVRLFLTQVDYDLNMLDGDGNSPLHHAATSGDVDIVTMMVNVFNKNHSSVDLSNKLGETPLMIASKLGFLACAKVLISVGLASLTKRDNVNFMNALELAQTNASNSKVNLSNMYCSPDQKNSARSNSAPKNLVGNDDKNSKCDDHDYSDDGDDNNTKSMARCLATAYRIYEVQNSASYRMSSTTPVKPTPAILTSFFDFHKDGSYSIEDVMWLVSKCKVVPNNGIPKSLLRRHTDSRLSQHSVSKSTPVGNTSVLETLSLDLDSRLRIPARSSDSSESDLDSADDVFYSVDSDETDSSDTKCKQRKRPKHRIRASRHPERSDSKIPEHLSGAESSDEQATEDKRHNTCSDRFLTPPVAKQRSGPFTDIRILKVMNTPENTKRHAKTPDMFSLRPESLPTREYRTHSDSALDTKAFISSPSIARWQNAVSEIRNKIQNNVRFNLESRSSTRSSRPRTGLSSRTNSASTRKVPVVCRRNSESNKYSTQILDEPGQEFTMRNSQSIPGRKTRSRNKKNTSPALQSSTTVGQKPKRENRREWKRQQEIESEKRRNDLNRKIACLRSELDKMDARWHARKYHPQLSETMLSNINTELACRRTPGAQSEDETEPSDTLNKTQLTSSNIDVRFNTFDSRLSWSAKCPTDSSLTSSISLPSLGWSSSSEDLLRSEECEKEGPSYSVEIDKLRKQGRKQRLRQISSIRRPAQAPNKIVTVVDSSKICQSEYSRLAKPGPLFMETKKLKITMPTNPLAKARNNRQGNHKRFIRRFQQHP